MHLSNLHASGLLASSFLRKAKILLLFCSLFLSASSIGSGKMMKIAVVGATGGLGQQIVKLGVARGHEMTCVVRNLEKAREMFGAEASIVVADLATGTGLDEAFAGKDAVVEVISNEERPHGIATIIAKCESNNVDKLAVIGGAGALYTSAEKNKRVYTDLAAMPGMEWITPITLLHLQVQELAFKSSVRVVMQIEPPGMTATEATGAFEATKQEVSAGVFSVSYADVAALFLDSLAAAADDNNRQMIGLAPKASTASEGKDEM